MLCVVGFENTISNFNFLCNWPCISCKCVSVVKKMVCFFLKICIFGWISHVKIWLTYVNICWARDQGNDFWYTFLGNCLSQTLGIWYPASSRSTGPILWDPISGLLDIYFLFIKIQPFLSLTYFFFFFGYFWKTFIPFDLLSLFSLHLLVIC